MVSDDTDERKTDRIRQECWRRAVNAYGTAHIFEDRARSIRTRLRILEFSGLVVPLSVGALVLAFGADTPALDLIVTVAAVIAGIQFIVALWALVARWDDEFGFAKESAADNHRLSKQFAKLARTVPDDLQTQFEIRDAEYTAREKADYQRGISEKEKRKGMRAGLRQFQRSCSICGEVPKSLEPSDCPNCGNF